jgi:decaprenylphospho-beta-D-ribofuranose 2-oxidase
MSVIELSARRPPPGTQRSLRGWGGTAASSCRVFEAQNAEDVLAVLHAERPPGVGLIARGAGRSYGDAAQNGGGDVIDMTALDRIVAVDEEQMLISAEAGATIAQLMARLARHDLGLPVVPGTRHVTLAGAIASDIHGKNHHRDGGFARHVVSLSLCTPAGGLVEVSPESDPELFYGTLGGMGLTGIVLGATLRVERLASPWVSDDTDRTRGLAETLELMSGEERHRYSVAWLDLLAAPASWGRAIVSRADPLAAAEPTPPARRWRPAGGRYPASLSRRPTAVVPERFPGLLRPSSVRAFNSLRWRSAPRRERGRPRALVPYFFPLDALGAWNRLYGPRGLIQHQLVIPAGQEAALEAAFELIRRRRLPIYLAVFKRFGEAFGGPMSFPIAGWTLALDMPAGATGLDAALAELDVLVAGCGGRVYLAKDARLRPELLEPMYPQLAAFRALRGRVDPEDLLSSDLSRRVGIDGAPG